MLANTCVKIFEVFEMSYIVSAQWTNWGYLTLYNIVIMGIIIFFDVPCNPEDEGTVVLRNISVYKAAHSNITLLLEHQTTYKMAYFYMTS